MIGMMALVLAALLVTSRTGWLLSLTGLATGVFILSSYGFSLADLSRDVDDLPILQKIIGQAGLASTSESLQWPFEN